MQVSGSNLIKNKYFKVLKTVLKSACRDPSIYSIICVYLKTISIYPEILMKFICFCRGKCFRENNVTCFTSKSTAYPIRLMNNQKHFSMLEGTVAHQLHKVTSV